ncbi:MAG TPA: cobalamin-independent methionine synthase II family protein [Dehalococcoidia bacterium]|nr:cobalamin-independent methionine synthase II family protein [Dehalococcoidia bacterium]
MKDRILTTHAGSLPRPPQLIDAIRRKENGEQVEGFDKLVRDAVADTVRLQREAGVDIVSDGEEGKPLYATYIKNRVSGFNGTQEMPIRIQGEARDFPEFSERRMAGLRNVLKRPTCDGPIAWTDFDAVKVDIDNLKAATQGMPGDSVFMTAASPGVIQFFLGNAYYKTEEEYLQALANVMREEYEAIYKAGFQLQLDCPDVAMSRQSEYFDLSLGDFKKVVARNVEILNEATKNIPGEAMRFHMCWGNYEGPHHLDVPLRDIINEVLRTRASGISFEGANPRHEHEWNVWKDVKLPDDKYLIPGVIDSTTNFIEHPELVAQRIKHYADLVGKENVIAGVDCGFGTNAASTNVDHRIVWAKLAALTEGAALASKQLW